MQENLHFVVVGHVDHGKSTLIGRLLYDTNSLPPDKIEEVRRMGEQYQGQPEFAFVMDHLEEERRQRITIDTAQIFFKTAKRDYVIIDAPGHKQFLKNMITGASQAEAALLLVDAEEGLREQTHRHAYMLSLLGLRQVVVVINKMDLVDYSQERFDEVAQAITARLAEFNVTPLRVIPISARLGDNVAGASENLAWHEGPTLLAALDELQCIHQSDAGPLRFPVQDVYEIEGEKVLVGRVASGVVNAGQQLCFQPAGPAATVERIKILDGELDRAAMGQSIGLTLTGDSAAAIERGMVACNPQTPIAEFPTVSATVFWMSPRPLQVGEKLEVKCATQQIAAVVDRIANRLDTSTLDIIAAEAEQLAETEVATLTLTCEKPLCLDSFDEVVETGQFVLMRGPDTVAGGVFHGG